MRVPIKTPSADDLLRQFKEDLDQWFGLSLNPVKPENRLTDETAKRFAALCREDDRLTRLEERLASLERMFANLNSNQGKSS